MYSWGQLGVIPLLITSHSLSLSPSLSISISVSHSLSVSLSLYLRLSLCFSLCLSLSLSASPSPPSLPPLPPSLHSPPPSLAPSTPSLPPLSHSIPPSTHSSSHPSDEKEHTPHFPRNISAASLGSLIPHHHHYHHHHHQASNHHHPHPVEPSVTDPLMGSTTVPGEGELRIDIEKNDAQVSPGVYLEWVAGSSFLFSMRLGPHSPCFLTVALMSSSSSPR